MDILIRPYRPEDLSRVKELTVEAFDGVSIDQNIERRFGPIGNHDWRWRKSRHIDEDVVRPGSQIFVAEADGRVVGHITTWIDRDASMGLIPNLAVDKTCRGGGIGRKLIEFAQDFFREQGLTHARIETLEQNPIGRHLYPSTGFEEVARQIHYCMSLEKKPAK